MTFPTGPLKIGQTIAIDGFPVQIEAIAAHYDILDNYVILGKSDFLGYITAECDIQGESVQYITYLPDREEAVHSYVERAFGNNV